MESNETQAQSSDFAPPSRPAKMLTRVVESPDNTTFRIDAKAGAVSLFLMLWLAGWSVGCVTLVTQAITKMDWKMALFAVPFVGAWFLVAGLMFNMWRGYESLTVSKAGLDHERGSVFGKKSRHLNFAELRSIDVVTTTHSDEDSTYQRHRIDITTSSLPMSFAQDSMNMTRITLAEADWLKNEILMAVGLYGGQEAFDRLLGAAVPTKSDQVAPASDASPASNFVPPDLTGSPIANTSTTPLRFRVIEAPDALLIEQPYAWSISKMVTVLLFGAFWNGVVGVFVTQLVSGQPPGGMWWFLLVFLIPFELVGLLLIVGFIGELLGPVRKQVWEISSDRLVQRSCVAMFGWTTPIDAASITTVRRQDITLTGLSKFAGKVGGAEAQALAKAQALQDLKKLGPYELAFLDAADKPMLTIPFLTELEADAIERALRSRVPRWYENRI